MKREYLIRWVGLYSGLFHEEYADEVRYQVLKDMDRFYQILNVKK